MSTPTAIPWPRTSGEPDLERVDLIELLGPESSLTPQARHVVLLTVRRSGDWMVWPDDGEAWVTHWRALDAAGGYVTGGALRSDSRGMHARPGDRFLLEGAAR